LLRFLAQYKCATQRELNIIQLPGAKRFTQFYLNSFVIAAGFARQGLSLFLPNKSGIIEQKISQDLIYSSSGFAGFIPACLHGRFCRKFTSLFYTSCTGAAVKQDRKENLAWYTWYVAAGDIIVAN
jgi:hypothetical protein